MDGTLVEEQQDFGELQKLGNFEITPCEDNFETRRDLVKLDADTYRTTQISGLFSQLPAIAGTAAMSNAWVMKFPEGVTGTLMQLKAGGYSTPIMGEKGIVGHAALFRPSAQTAVLGAFTAMSVVSGQYFLARINSEMKKMNASLDKILEFLYGDKKAELVSELIFVSQAHRNFQYISGHDEQRAATIVGLQSARKVAVRDIEFYIADLDSTVKSKQGDFVKRAMMIKDSLETAMQLYALSTVLEVYYSGNFDENYISDVEKESSTYIAKCDSRILNSFSELGGVVAGMKQLPFLKIDKAECEKQIAEITSKLTSGEESELRRAMKAAFSTATKSAEYYVNSRGEVYMKA